RRSRKNTHHGGTEDTETFLRRDHGDRGARAESAIRRGRPAEPALARGREDLNTSQMYSHLACIPILSPSRRRFAAPRRTPSVSSFPQRWRFQARVRPSENETANFCASTYDSTRFLLQPDPRAPMLHAGRRTP